MPAEFDEQPLVRFAREGDLDAFNILVDRYQGFLFRIALRMLGDEDDAADAAQVAWISAFRKIKGFRGGHLRTWLARIVVNTCYDELRRRHRRREVSLVPVNGEGERIEEDFWLADAAPGVEQRADVRQFEYTVQGCLQSLAPVYRTMLVLVDIEGLSYEEAAAAAGVPLGTVRSRVSRARMALRQSLKETADLLSTPTRFQTPFPKQSRVRCP
jgi:RNA polymerase sigma-70 factor (ECF subfamily)